MQRMIASYPIFTCEQDPHRGEAPLSIAERGRMQRNGIGLLHPILGLSPSPVPSKHAPPPSSATLDAAGDTAMACQTLSAAMQLLRDSELGYV